MNADLRKFPLPHGLAGWVLALALSLGGARAAEAADLLSLPFPEPSTNGALHYNRAILSMSQVALEDREVLLKPIWEVFGKATREEIDTALTKALFDFRHVIRATLMGCRQQRTEFGIDYADYGHDANLPHAQPMLQLGRLLTLAGIQAQIRGEWETAANYFFHSLRLGRHMTSQPTLVECLVGVEVLENNYYALAYWGSKCPEPVLVKQAFLRFEIGSRTMVEPVITLAQEASIVQRQMDRLKQAFPDGIWAEMLLESMGQYAASRSADEEMAVLKQFLTDRGLPTDILENRPAFEAFVDRISKLHVTYLQTAAACMDLPPLMRIQRAQSIMDAYEKRFAEVGDAEMLDLKQLGRFFATHTAEQTMARVALAVSASRTDDGFPETLQAVAPLFVGDLPKSPYDGSALEYKRLPSGADFLLAVPQVEAAGDPLPRVHFSSSRDG